MSLYVKWPSGFYSPCSFTEGGGLYIIYFVDVPRGIKRKGESKAPEVMIQGLPPKKWKTYLAKKGAIIVIREEAPEEDQMLKLGKEELK